MLGERLRAALGRFMTVAALIGLYALLRGIGPAATTGQPSASLAMALGFLLLAAFLAGQLATTLGLPRITGYLACGLLIGPEALGLVTSRQVEGFAAINAMAVAVIAFIAGGELRPAMLRERGRLILIMLLVEVAAVFLAVGLALMALRPWVPFLAELDALTAGVVVALFAAIATIHSPAVTIALLEEQAPQGPLTSTTLGIVVAADVVVVLLATATLALAKAKIGGEAVGVGVAGLLAWELVGALIAGAVLGGLINLYLRVVGARYELFALAVAFFGGQLAALLHVEYMLFMLSAGFIVVNVGPTSGEPLLRAFEKVSVPAYALFFSLAGAAIHLDEIRTLWPVALAVVIVRAGALWAGCRVGAHAAGAEPVVTRYTWLGLISQAGVALGLVTVATEALPEVGAGMAALFLAIIAMHETLGPIAFRFALVRSGESGRAREGTVAPRPRAMAH